MYILRIKDEGSEIKNTMLHDLSSDIKRKNELIDSRNHILENIRQQAIATIKREEKVVENKERLKKLYQYMAIDDLDKELKNLNETEWMAFKIENSTQIENIIYGVDEN